VAGKHSTECEGDTIVRSLKSGPARFGCDVEIRIAGRQAHSVEAEVLAWELTGAEASSLRGSSFRAEVRGWGRMDRPRDDDDGFESVKRARSSMCRGYRRRDACEPENGRCRVVAQRRFELLGDSSGLRAWIGLSRHSSVVSRRPAPLTSILPLREPYRLQRIPDSAAGVVVEKWFSYLPAIKANFTAATSPCGFSGRAREVAVQTRRGDR